VGISLTSDYFVEVSGFVSDLVDVSEAGVFDSEADVFEPLESVFDSDLDSDLDSLAADADSFLYAPERA